MINEATKRYLRTDKGKAAMKRYFQSPKGKEAIRKATKKYRATHPLGIAKQRTKLLTFLGGRCSNTNCLVPGGCEDSRCLQIDHKTGGGSKELKRLNSYFCGYYNKNLDLAKERLQILCANCNWIKRYEKNECTRLYVPRT